MDKIKFEIEYHERLRYRMVNIIINGDNLIDTLKEIEKPYAMKEGNPEIAGNYVGLRSKMIFYPSKHLMGKPDPNHEYTPGKSSILECNCGCSGCWPFEVKIEVKPKIVIWRNFQQPHRSTDEWTYDKLRPFIFDRKQYEKEWKKLDFTRLMK